MYGELGLSRKMPSWTFMPCFEAERKRAESFSVVGVPHLSVCSGPSLASGGRGQVPRLAGSHQTGRGREMCSSLELLTRHLTSGTIR